MARRSVSMIAAILALAAWGGIHAQEAPPAEAPAAETPALSEEDFDVTGIEQILRGDQEMMQGGKFSYDPAGRRDPFRSLLDGLTGPEEGEIAERPPGLAGMLVEELTLQGIIETSAGILAFVQGRDQLSYIIRPGTKLYNGEVNEIQPKRVIFRQQVNDPKALRPYEEIVRELVD